MKVKGVERFEGLVAGERVCRTKIVWSVHKILLMIEGLVGSVGRLRND
jgi:hypothetical protein